MGKLRAVQKQVLPEYALVVLVGVLVGATVTLSRLPSVDMVKWVLVSFFLLVFGFNALNGVFDIMVDKINKPGRPLPKGELTKDETIFASILFYAAGLFIAYAISLDILALALIFTVFSIAYSVPPLRLKSKFMGINFVGGVLYGVIPLIAGSLVVDNAQIPFAIAIYVFIIAGIASSIKDFEDHLGDDVYHIKSLPVVFGVNNAAKLVSFSIIFITMAFIAYSFLANNLKFMAGGSLALVFSIFLGVSLNNGSNHRSKVSRKDLTYQSNFTRICILLGLLMEASFIFVYM
jgi:geranylgeranylglycerol-phosphate geranylgeranyltransferase